MVRFQCDTCGKLKEENENWILGLAAENIGVTSARREISIADAWERSRAVERLAVHFCSDSCRAKFVQALFSESPETLQGDATVTRRRIQRVVPGAVVETMVSETPRPSPVTRSRRKKIS
ncbi:MAG TPA: hypothetical protein VI636_00590 [Candidatus Angelobacter sp.]